MVLAIHTIKKSKGAQKTRKTIGRGNGSGIGTYSGRGLKGQKSRSGVSRLRLKKIGMKRGRSALRGIPKLAGFKSLQPKNQVVNISVINEKYSDNEIVSPKTLLKKGIIDNIKTPVKILGKDELKIKNIKFENVKLNNTISTQIK